jgi:hypothetical protein
VKLAPVYGEESLPFTLRSPVAIPGLQSIGEHL